MYFLSSHSIVAHIRDPHRQIVELVPVQVCLVHESVQQLVDVLLDTGEREPSSSYFGLGLLEVDEIFLPLGDNHVDSRHERIHRQHTVTYFNRHVQQPTKQFFMVNIEYPDVVQVRQGILKDRVSERPVDDGVVIDGCNEYRRGLIVRDHASVAASVVLCGDLESLYPAAALVKVDLRQVRDALDLLFNIIPWPKEHHRVVIITPLHDQRRTCG
mmetsp:Transcript_15419/g.25517  ORF Transcript_15419/g.25517 Transcript_15419/m.25517 type:complete len:214 (-) Transcript_15419:828-1469(-)